MAVVLIAEDEPHIAHVLALWLKRNGHQVVEVGDGALALNELRNRSIDILITDMNMPELDGMELVRKVRGELNLELPIVLLTARCDQETLADELERFRVCLYPKPFVPSRLVRELDRLLGTVVTRGMN